MRVESLKNIVVQRKSGAVPVVDLIEWWCGAVLRLWEERHAEGINSGLQVPEDVVDKLVLRDQIEDALRAAGVHANAPLLLADEMWRFFTVTDPWFVNWVGGTPDDERFGWWWHRRPHMGPIADEIMRRRLAARLAASKARREAASSDATGTPDR